MSKRDISHLSELDAPTANADVYGAAIGTGAPIKKVRKKISNSEAMLDDDILHV